MLLTGTGQVLWNFESVWVRLGHLWDTEVISFKKTSLAGQWWWTPLIPACGRQRQVDLWIEASLVYRWSSRTAQATQRNPVSKHSLTLSSVLWFLCHCVLRKRSPTTHCTEASVPRRFLGGHGWAHTFMSLIHLNFIFVCGTSFSPSFILIGLPSAILAKTVFCMELII